MPRIIFAAALIFCQVFGAFYLLGAFVAADFVLSNWDAGLRGLVALVGGLAAVIVAGAVAAAMREGRV